MHPLSITLASSSPRRIALLRNLGLQFQTVSPDAFQEIMIGAPAEQLAVQNAIGKARLASPHAPAGLIIGCDTVIAMGDAILGKPHTDGTAKETLRMLSGKTHRVVSGLALIDTRNNREWSDCAVSEVTFRSISEEEINAYVATGEPLDKAGAYAIQGQGRKFVNGVKGSETNIVGLPIELLKIGMECLDIPFQISTITQ